MASKTLPVLKTTGVMFSRLLLATLVPEVSTFAETNSPEANVVSQGPAVLQLWPGQAPDEMGGIGPERARMSPKLDCKQVEVTEPTRLITDVTKPSITIFLSAPMTMHARPGWRRVPVGCGSRGF